MKSTKFRLRCTVGETLLTFKELSTLAAQVEAAPTHNRSRTPLRRPTRCIGGHFWTFSHRGTAYDSARTYAACVGISSARLLAAHSAMGCSLSSARPVHLKMAPSLESTSGWFSRAAHRPAVSTMQMDGRSDATTPPWEEQTRSGGNAEDRSYQAHTAHR